MSAEDLPDPAHTSDARPSESAAQTPRAGSAAPGNASATVAAATTDVARTAQRRVQNRGRFRIFIIDSGWNSAASRALHSNMSVLKAFTDWDPIYVLDQETSVAVLREHRDLIGRDPIITVHDTWAFKRHGHEREHGFRMHLGLLRDEDKVLAALQMFTNFMARHRMSKDLETHVHRNLRKSGIAGAIEIVGGGLAHTTALLE